MVAFSECFRLLYGLTIIYVQYFQACPCYHCVQLYYCVLYYVSQSWPSNQENKKGTWDTCPVKETLLIFLFSVLLLAYLSFIVLSYFDVTFSSSQSLNKLSIRLYLLRHISCFELLDCQQLVSELWGSHHLCMPKIIRYDTMIVVLVLIKSTQRQPISPSMSDANLVELQHMID